MCIDRLREGKKTACEAVCVAKAIMTGTHEEIARFNEKKKAIGQSLSKIETGI